jgi:GNAT superfamily N-acetyltransferase
MIKTSDDDSLGNTACIEVIISPYECMGNASDSAKAVKQIHITARTCLSVIGELHAQIFDMQKLAEIGAMQVFDESEGTDAIFSMLYAGCHAENESHYPFTQDFLEVLSQHLCASEESVAACGMGFRIAHLETIKIEKQWQRQGIGSLMVKALLKHAEAFDFLVGQAESIEYHQYLNEHYPIHQQRLSFVQSTTGQLMRDHFQQGILRFYERLGMRIFEADGVTWFLV